MNYMILQETSKITKKQNHLYALIEDKGQNMMLYVHSSVSEEG